MKILPMIVQLQCKAFQQSNNYSNLVRTFNSLNLREEFKREFDLRPLRTISVRFSIQIGEIK